MKNKGIKAALIAQTVVVLLILAFMLFPKMDRTFGSDELVMKMGRYDADGLYTDNTLNSVGVFVTTPDMDLSYGTYCIDIEYSADSDRNMAYISLPAIMAAEENINDRFVANTVMLSSDSHKETIDVLVNTSQKDYIAAVYYMGDGSLKINSIRIYKTNGGILRLALITTVLFAAADCIYVIYRRRKEGKLTDESMRTGFLLGAISIFASIPLLLNYMIEGHDLSFHLLRIEGIKEGLIMGTFPIKIQPNWLSGNGYAASVFYGDILLYIPALLRLCGFNITESYNIFVFLTNVATCLVSYYCFKRMSGSSKTAVAGSMLYTLSLYRIVNIYIRSAVGEYTAMIFLPLIAYGMWKIFTEDVKSPSYRRNWIIPVIGFAGIINTHILTCEMVGAFILILCLILVKRVFRKETFIVLVKTVAYTCILCAGFLVPFLDYMLQGGFVVTSAQRFAAGIQQFGAFVGQLLVPFAGYSGLSVNVADGMAGEFPSTTGLAVIVGAVILLYVLVMGYMKEKKYRVCSWIMLGFGTLSLLFSSHVFPWDTLQNMNGLFNKLVSMISMPWRFLTIASLTLSTGSVIALAVLEKRGEAYKWVITALTGIAVIQAGALMADIMNTAQPYAVYSDSALDDGNLIGCEYLPAEGLQEAYASQYAYATDNLDFEQTYRYNNKVIFNVSNNSNEQGMVNLSMVYYKGYTARDKNTGKKLTTYPANGYTTGIVIEAGYSGEVVVEFEGFWYWKLAAVISIISVLVICMQAYMMMKGDDKSDTSEGKIWRTNSLSKKLRKIFHR
ncbi:MAG: hypothetical protein ACI4R6_05765 [Lachnospiraceae bacterium]